MCHFHASGPHSITWSIERATKIVGIIGYYTRLLKHTMENLVVSYNAMSFVYSIESLIFLRVGSRDTEETCICYLYRRPNYLKIQPTELRSLVMG